MPAATSYHVPVLLDEVLTLLSGASHVLDGTLGGGGHTAALLGAGATVTGIDRDPRALAEARARLADAEREGRFRAVRGNYADVAELLPPDERFDGVLLDLGVSSHQVDDPARGFTFREGAPLDMRMGDSDDGEDAAALLNARDEVDLAALFRHYADEPRAARLAREIVRRREHRPFETADDLVNAIRAVLGAKSGPADFARIFQAVRIAVNDELEGLERALPAVRDRLAPGGVLAVISYHSGEDRLVKHAFRAWSTACTCPPRQPVCTCDGRALGRVLTRRAITASDAEIAANPRARSARLRAFAMTDEADRDADSQNLTDRTRRSESGRAGGGSP